MSLEDLLDTPVSPWMSGNGPDGDIALSSRIRLARNLEGVPFPNKSTLSQMGEVMEQARESVADLSAAQQKQYIFIRLEQLSPLERFVLVEKHIISPAHAQEPNGRALLVRSDCAVSIMINEEDHFRIQCLVPGHNLERAFALADSVDDILEKRHNFAYSEQLGYLTACPTNLGTGLRASVMLHLPALVLTQQINRIVTAATQLGMAVRGLYGEGTEAAGNIFQFSNQLTLGPAEQDIIENLAGVVKQVIDHERTARNLLLKESKDSLADRVWRAYGVLRYARSISGQEALSLLSEVRMGIDLKIIQEAPPEIFNELLVLTRPNFLQKLAGRGECSLSDRDQMRADIIRKRLKR